MRLVDSIQRCTIVELDIFISIFRASALTEGGHFLWPTGSLCTKETVKGHLNHRLKAVVSGRYFWIRQRIPVWVVN